jgi:Fe-S cluster assembly protein SufD
MAALAQAKVAATEARLAALDLPQSGAWLRRAREAALGRLQAMGLPGRRDEYWKFTDPGSLISANANRAAVFDSHDETPVFDTIDRLKIVFVDGVFDPVQSDDLALAGIEIARLADAGSQDLHWARDLYGVLEARGQTPVARPLAALATAYATDGLLIRALGARAGR